MPVVTYAGLDCDNPEFGSGEPLYAAPFKLGAREDALDYYASRARATPSSSSPGAQARHRDTPILQTQNENQLFQRVRAEGFKAKVVEVCPECKLEPLMFTTEQLVSGKGQQVFKSGILRNPRMDVLYYANDAFLVPGLQPALESNKGKFKIVCCGDGGKQGLANLRRSGELADVYAINAAPVTMWGWGALDVMNRALAGEQPADVPGQAHISFYADPEHNLPPRAPASTSRSTMRPSTRSCGPTGSDEHGARRRALEQDLRLHSSARRRQPGDRPRPHPRPRRGERLREVDADQDARGRASRRSRRHHPRRLAEHPGRRDAAPSPHGPTGCASSIRTRACSPR